MKNKMYKGNPNNMNFIDNFYFVITFSFIKIHII